MLKTNEMANAAKYFSDRLKQTRYMWHGITEQLKPFMHHVV